MKTRSIGCVLLVAASVLNNCAASAPPRHVPAVSTAPSGGQSDPVTSAAFAIPKVYPALPARAHLDLGPVLVTTRLGERAVPDVLLTEGQRLGADGFTIERRGISDVYGIDLRNEAAWRTEHPGLSVATDIAKYLLTGEIGGDLNSPQTKERRAYYRAFRYVDEVPPALALTADDLDEALHEFFESAVDRQAQLTVAHGLLAASIIDVKAYERLRARLAG
ncbi:MAG: hypothetical protein V3T05_01315 [Myxococcota bacterium]